MVAMEMPEFSTKTNIASSKAHRGSGENFVVANVAAARGSATAPSGAINLGRIVGEIAFCVHYFPIFVSLCGDVVKNGFCVCVGRRGGQKYAKTDRHTSLPHIRIPRVHKGYCADGYILSSIGSLLRAPPPPRICIGNPSVAVPRRLSLSS